MAWTYHEPAQFRWSLSAFIQAARSVTFMLQAEKSKFQDFTFYDRWQQSLPSIFKWLNSVRVETVHKAAIMPSAYVEIWCIDDEGEPFWYPVEEDNEFPQTVMLQSPAECSHALMSKFRCPWYAKSPGNVHSRHYLLRSWNYLEPDLFQPFELLDMCAYLYRYISSLIEEAHSLSIGQGSLVTISAESSGHLPCMQSLETIRSAYFESIENGISFSIADESAPCANFMRDYRSDAESVWNANIPNS